MSTAFRPRDFEASINIYCKKRIISLSGLCCNKVSINELNQNTNNFIKLKKFSEEVQADMVSHTGGIQKIIDYELKKKIFL